MLIPKFTAELPIRVIEKQFSSSIFTVRIEMTVINVDFKERKKANPNTNPTQLNTAKAIRVICDKAAANRQLDSLLKYTLYNYSDEYFEEQDVLTQEKLNSLGEDNDVSFYEDCCDYHESFDDNYDKDIEKLFEALYSKELKNHHPLTLAK